MCALARRDFSNGSNCTHVYATGRLQAALGERPRPRWRRTISRTSSNTATWSTSPAGAGSTRLYFLEPSSEHGPFLSQMDHNRLQEYHAFGLDVYWVCGLNRRLMVHTMRDRMGYFVAVDRLADFHKSMLFAFYGSNRTLSRAGEDRLGDLLDALIGFWGKTIGIVTGGGSGVMEQANTLARRARASCPAPTSWKSPTRA